MQEPSQKFIGFVGPTSTPAVTPAPEPGPNVTAPRTLCRFCGGERTKIWGLTAVCCPEATREDIYGKEAY